MRGNERAPLETFVASVSFSYFFQIISFRPMQAAESVCVCVRACVCRRESPCAMRSWINTLVPDWDWQASSTWLRISQAKQANVENIISHTRTHTHACTHTLSHTKNRHILFVLSYQYRRSAKQGQMQLFAQSTQTSTANSAKKEREREREKQTAKRSMIDAKSRSFKIT